MKIAPTYYIIIHLPPPEDQCRDSLVNRLDYLMIISRQQTCTAQKFPLENGSVTIYLNQCYLLRHMTVIILWMFKGMKVE